VGRISEAWPLTLPALYLAQGAVRLEDGLSLRNPISNRSPDEPEGRAMRA
jgi:hypothetical protein